MYRSIAGLWLWLASPIESLATRRDALSALSLCTTSAALAPNTAACAASLVTYDFTDEFGRPQLFGARYI